ncbi:hypothetical protein M1M93_01760 [Thermodesulfovibrionales bacterium]|nr:hypothetical protein [Thermodesulfovibrionales bacterium]
MTLAIKAIRMATAGEWDYIWKNCDYATYFHSREWAGIWQKYTQEKMQPDAKIHNSRPDPLLYRSLLIAKS